MIFYLDWSRHPQWIWYKLDKNVHRMCTLTLLTQFHLLQCWYFACKYNANEINPKSHAIFYINNSWHILCNEMHGNERWCVMVFCCVFTEWKEDWNGIKWMRMDVNIFQRQIPFGSASPFPMLNTMRHYIISRDWFFVFKRIFLFHMPKKNHSEFNTFFVFYTFFFEKRGNKS